MTTAPKPRGRPKGSLNRRTELRAILAEEFPEGVNGFLRVLVTQAKAGCVQSQTAILNRLYPTLKPESPAVTLPRKLTGSTAEQARQVVQYASTGHITISAAQDLLSAIADCVRIETGDDLLKRIEALEGEKV